MKTTNKTYGHHTFQGVHARIAVTVVLISLLLLSLSTGAQDRQLHDLRSHTALVSDTSYVYLGDTTEAALKLQAAGDEELPFDEVYITLHVQRIGSLEIPAVIHDMRAYLPVKDIFDFLKIRAVATAEFDSITGFFIQPSAVYVIDQSKARIYFQNKIFDLGTGTMIRLENGLFLRSDLFGRIFGLDCQFDFRSLSVTLNSKTELPAIREMQQDLMRRNLSRIQGERKADTTITPAFSFFRPGAADWMIMRQKEGETINSTRATLAMGAMLAGGEMNLLLNYNSNQPFRERQQFYSWKYVNNDNRLIRQLTAGKIFTPSISSLFSPLKGLHITNAPSTYRRSFGSYPLSDHTEPGWMVELYVNNVLVNYMKADASGFYSFDVPMVYGTSTVQLRFYGPWGEERTKDVNISIPFNFLPVNQLEYAVSAGLVDDGAGNKFARSVINYGLSRRITVGSGMEYLTSANAGKIMPFAQASVRVGTGMLLTGERMHGVRSKGVLSWRLPLHLQFDLNYIKYDRDQTAVRFVFREEKKLTASMPLRGKKFSAFSRLTVSQFTSATEKITSSELIFSSVVAGISSNLTTFALFDKNKQPFIYTALSMAFRFPKGIRLTPHVQYEYRQQEFSMLKMELEKTIGNKGFLNLSYEKDVLHKGEYITAGLRYNFSFAQTFMSARRTRTGAAKQNSFSNMYSARGSLVYDQYSKKLMAGNQNAVGKGGLVFAPYLDLNCNAQRDAGEPGVAGLRLRMNGGRMTMDKKDSTIRVSGLEPYATYFFELDKNSFDQVAWQIRRPTLQITVEPDHFQRVEIPVAVVGEVSGTVLLKTSDTKDGLGRVLVNVYNEKDILVAKTLTENDGYFSYLGLAPGNYKAVIDEKQLVKLGLSITAPQPFRIRAMRDGDVVDTVQFILEKKAE